MRGRGGFAWPMAWLMAAILVCLVTLWPPWAFRPHPHWERVSWMPLADPRSEPWEVVGNLLLFLPLGYAGTRALGASRHAVVVASLGAMALSVGVESAQLFVHGRFPSTTDLVFNVAGAVLGAALARRRAGSRRVGSD